jgi:GxxExxY protein
LSYQIVGCVFDVHNEVGPGLREECYQKAMELRLTQKGIPFIAKPRTRRELWHRGQIIDVFEPDMVVARQVVLELKHQPNGFAPENYSQIISYLKFWKLELGLLVNFAMDSAVIERVPFLPFDAELDENYDYLSDGTPESHKPTLRLTREAILRLFQDIGLGYNSSTYRNFCLSELADTSRDEARPKDSSFP